MIIDILVSAGAIANMVDDIASIGHFTFAKVPILNSVLKDRFRLVK